MWKSIYQHEETFYVDAIRTVQSSTWCLGESIRIFDYQYHLPDLDKDSQQAKDIERFRWFSQDYLGYDDARKLVTDIRYSMLPNQIKQREFYQPSDRGFETEIKKRMDYWKSKRADGPENSMKKE